MNDWRPQTKAAQALGWIDEKTRALIPPIHMSSTYQRDADNEYRSGRRYSRDDNPTYDQPEALLNELEGGAGCLLFSSGMAAATSVFQALAPGDRVVAPEKMYWGLRQWLRSQATKWGLRVDFVQDMGAADLEAILGSEETRLVWIETPANPTWDVVDIETLAGIAHKAGTVVAVDNTVATPVLTQPLSLGADIVMHSATKYLNGHSDVVGGALVTAEQGELWSQIGTIRHSQGCVLGPFEAWLLLRGMRTLPLRVSTACRNALSIAQHFKGHPAVRHMLYPGLTSHPGNKVAMRQMRGGYGAMLSIRLADSTSAIAVAARTKVFKRATSLGGIESLIEHRASIEGSESIIPSDLLRLSIGIEDCRDLIDDLEQALHSL